MSSAEEVASVARHQEHKSERLCPPRLGIRVATETSTVKRRPDELSAHREGTKTDERQQGALVPGATGARVLTCPAARGLRPLPIGDRHSPGTDTRA